MKVNEDKNAGVQRDETSDLLRAASAELYAYCERQRKLLDALAPLAFHPKASRYLPGNVGEELKSWLKEFSPLDKLRRALTAAATGEQQ